MENDHYKFDSSLIHLYYFLNCWVKIFKIWINSSFRIVGFLLGIKLIASPSGKMICSINVFYVLSSFVVEIFYQFKCLPVFRRRRSLFIL